MSKRIITLGRELGSGGSSIGKDVAKRLGISYVDRELVNEAAKNSGLSEEFLEMSDQNLTSSFLFNIATTTGFGAAVLGAAGKDQYSMDTQVFSAFRDVILDIAAKEPCLIVGRSADFILRERDDVLRVFIYADMQTRIKRMIERHDETEKTAQKALMDADKRRGRHYQAFTNQPWGHRGNYDLLLNSGELGLDMCAKIIVDAYNA